MCPQSNSRGAEALVISLIAVATVVLQLLVGDVPCDVLRFPLNIILAAVAIVAMVDGYRRRRSSPFVSFMLSPRAMWLSLFMMVALGITLGLQRRPATTSWPVVVALLYILLHLGFVILRGWRTGAGVRLRFLMLHLGLWLALFAMVVGAPDRVQMRAVVERDKPQSMAYAEDGRPIGLGYALRLDGFEASYYDNGTPSAFRADVEVDGRRVSLAVNHPHRLSWSERLYLVSYDREAECRYVVVEVVREPWQWLTTVGVVMLIVGAALLFLGGPRGVNAKSVR